MSPTPSFRPSPRSAPDPAQTPRSRTEKEKGRERHEKSPPAAGQEGLPGMESGSKSPNLTNTPHGQWTRRRVDTRLNGDSSYRKGRPEWEDSKPKDSNTWPGGSVPARRPEGQVPVPVPGGPEGPEPGRPGGPEPGHTSAPGPAAGMHSPDASPKPRTSARWARRTPSSDVHKNRCGGLGRQTSRS